MEILKNFSTTVKVFATKKSLNKRRDLECKEGKVNLEILKDSGTTVKKIAHTIKINKTRKNQCNCNVGLPLFAKIIRDDLWLKEAIFEVATVTIHMCRNEMKNV